MFNINRSKLTDFNQIFNNHRYFVNRMNIYLLNIRLIQDKYRHMDKQTYDTCFRNALSAIELNSDPIESIVPYSDVDTDGFENDRSFYLNYETEEAKEIVEKIDAEVMRDTLLPGSELATKFANDEVSLKDLVDDVYLHYLVTKYWEQINAIRFQAYSNLSKLIEYTTELVNMKTLKNYMISKKLNETKYAEKCQDIICNYEMTLIYRFFNNAEVLKEFDIKPFDLQNLLIRLATNLTVKSDIYIILGIYGACSFASVELMKPNKQQPLSPCVDFVRMISEYMNS